MPSPRMTEVSAIAFPLSYVAIFANRLLLNLAAGHQAGRAEGRPLGLGMWNLPRYAHAGSEVTY